MIKYRHKKLLVRYSCTLLVIMLVGCMLGYLLDEGMHRKTAPLSETSGAGDAVALPSIETALALPAHSSTVLASTLEVQQVLAQAEEMFEATVRSCLGAYCFDDAVKGVVRVGLLMPDQTGGHDLWALLNATGAYGPKLEISYASNVPAYGYGKNHGYSRIIRVAKRVLPNAVALLREGAEGGGRGGEDLLEAQVQQLLRWHCRLSHVAAHTSMLTVFADDLLARPTAELEKMASFVGVRVDRRTLKGAVQQQMPALRRAWGGLSELSGAQSQGTQGTAAGAVQGPRAQEENESLLGQYQRGLKAMQLEMQSTADLSEWPCRSFHDFDPATTAALPIPPKALAADCDAPHVTCSVQFDRTEHERSQRSKK